MIALLQTQNVSRFLVCTLPLLPEGHSANRSQGRSSDSLPLKLPSRRGHPTTVAGVVRRYLKLTATGIVPDFHGVPYYSPPKNLVLQR